jgi:hypothetical protein
MTRSRHIYQKKVMDERFFIPNMIGFIISSLFIILLHSRVLISRKKQINILILRNQQKQLLEK